jgi:hypothetical protein
LVVRTFQRLVAVVLEAEDSPASSENVELQLSVNIPIELGGERFLVTRLHWRRAVVVIVSVSEKGDAAEQELLLGLMKPIDQVGEPLVAGGPDQPILVFNPGSVVQIRAVRSASGKSRDYRANE